MSEFSPICIYLVISLLVSLIPLGLLFCRNSLIAPYEFTMEKVLFVLRSLKEKLVNNLESLLLHGNEDFQEQILKREEKRRKSKNKAHMARKGNPISVSRQMSNFLVRISIVVFLCIVFITLSYSISMLLGTENLPILRLLQIKSTLLGKAIRSIFRILGWPVLGLCLSILASLLGSIQMMSPESASVEAALGEPSGDNSSSGVGASSGAEKANSGVDQASGSGDRSEPSALEQRAEELIRENLEQRKGDLAEGQKVAQVRRAVESNFEVETPGGEFELVKQMEKEVAFSKNEKCPATNAIFNEVKDAQSHVQDGRGGGNPFDSSNPKEKKTHE